MNYSLFIAQRLKLDSADNRATPSLNVALAGIVLAIIVMILSVAIVMGFKHEISSKIYSLDAHLKVSNAAIGLDDNYSTINAQPIYKTITSNTAFFEQVSSMSLIADQPAILKTNTDFEGIVYRGVDDGYDWHYLEGNLVSGRVPVIADTSDVNEVLISRELADKLRLKVGDRVYTYFILQKVKVRNVHVVGIVNNDFENFDKTIILGNIRQLQQINDWTADVGHYVGVNMKEVNHVEDDAYHLYSLLAHNTLETNNNTLHAVTNTHQNNHSFFAWLKMLDMNVVIILVLMAIVSGFTLIAAMLMIVLERIKMIGMLKAMGASNRGIRNIFIFLTGKLILRALLWGNAIGLSLALSQHWFHIVRLDPSAYYMPYVPIALSPVAWLLLNVGIVVVSYLTLLGPSYIISTIRPTATMRFE